MFEVLAAHYNEIKTPLDYFGESKYQVTRLLMILL
jgi:hypothetical protein